MITMERSYSTTEICRITGVTFRVLDYWTREEIITPEIREAKGSGSRREWSQLQLEHIGVMWIVHQYLVDYVGYRNVSLDVMHSLATALQERRPWMMGVSVDEDGKVVLGTGDF